MTPVAIRSLWPHSMTGRADDILDDWVKLLLARYPADVIGDRQRLRFEYLARFAEADTNREIEDLYCLLSGQLH